MKSAWQKRRRRSNSRKREEVPWGFLPAALGADTEFVGKLRKEREENKESSTEEGKREKEMTR